MYLEAKPPKLWRHGQLIVCRGKRVAGDILDLVKDDTGGLRDAEQAHEEGEHGERAEEFPITAL